jgi:hypothetical protein
MLVIICIILLPMLLKVLKRTYKLAGKSIDNGFDRLESKISKKDEG